MARFIGTFEEFKTFLGGYCRNKVRNFTTSSEDRRMYGKTCFFCGQNAELQAAHVKEKDRVQIIKKILKEHFEVEENQYSVDLQKFEQLFVGEHMPIEDHFHFLCQKCHARYDRGEISEEEVLTKKIEYLQRLIEEHRENLPTPTPLQKFMPSNPTKKSNMTRSQAVNILRQHDIYIEPTYTLAAKNTALPVYWSNPSIDCLTKPWYLVLNDYLHDTLYVFYIPGNSLSLLQLQTRMDQKEKINLEIQYDDSTFTDRKSGVSFRKYFLKEIKY